MKKLVLLALICTACGQASNGSKNTAKAPSSAEEMTSQCEAVGVWNSQNPDGSDVIITLQEDGTATLKHPNEGIDGGAWEEMGDQIWIFWDNGWIDRITCESEGNTRWTFAPGIDLNGPATATAPITKK